MVSKTVQRSPRVKNFFPTVLIVEEDADTRLMLKYLLEIWKYQVIEATENEEVIESAIAFQPDLILINLRIQGMDGLTASRRLREIPTLNQTAIIFVSASSDEKVRAAALAAGGDDFLTKPIDFGQLETILETQLKKTKTLNGGDL